jgi:hypothetical protein
LGSDKKKPSSLYNRGADRKAKNQVKVEPDTFIKDIKLDPGHSEKVPLHLLAKDQHIQS